MYQNDGRVVSSFIVQALRGEPLIIHGDGSQTRSFCYVDDLIDAMILMMSSKMEFTGPVNIGNPTEVTILEIAELIIQLTNSKSKIAFKPLPQDDPKQRKPNIDLAKAHLHGWEPKVGLVDGLKETINYFKDIL